MAESLNHRRRIETLEARVYVVETPPPVSSVSPERRRALFALVRKTVTTTALIIAALLSALKELGFLKP